MYVVISFNYKNSDVATRSKLAILQNHYNEFKHFGEVIIVTTCNRVEIVGFVNVFNPILVKIEKLTGINPKNAFIYKGVDAIRHIFVVLSSLDSMVVGETQITGQYKEAFMKAYEEGTIGKNLSRVMHYGFKCAKEVRNQTNISSKPVSVASIAVRKAKEVLGDFAGYSAVVVGAGDTGRIVCKHLEKHGVNIILLNRSYDKALKLKSEITEVNVDVYSIDKLKQFINQYRLLFSATSSKEPIINAELIEEKKFDRYWFDLAIPSDICLVELENVFIYRVDDLKDISDENIKKREQEVQKAYAVIDNCMDEYLKFLKKSEITPVIKKMRHKAQEISEDVLQNAIKKHFIKKEDAEEVRKILHTAFKRFLHNPTITLKENIDDARIDGMINNINKLFKFEENIKDDDCVHHTKDDI
jgi:glutamyl-tRNA reductase